MLHSIRFGFVFLALLSACRDSAAPDVTVDRVQLSTTALTIGPGETAQLSATPRTARGEPLADRVVSWTVEPAGIASVSAAGMLEGLDFGVAVVTATVEGKSATATVTVIPTAPRHLAAAWRMESFDGAAVPATYALFHDEPVGDGIVATVEIRLDSADTFMFDDARYQRRYCFTELHDAVVMYRYCWGDHGTFALGDAVPVPIVFTSAYIENVFTAGHVEPDGRLALSEELWLGEARRATRWARR